jgi:heterodisulfide reductase subunit C
MVSFIKHNAVLGRQIEQASHSAKTMCWTCGSCDFECPVNIATGRLRPQKIVRMANLGMLDELLHLPEIWYCLTCRRCMNICPNAVSPSMLIAFVRRDILDRGMVSMDAMRLYQDLFTKFQRVRWHAVNHCFKEELDFINDRVWHEWLEQPIYPSGSFILPQEPNRLISDVKTMMASSRTLACFTCGECSSACPVDCGRSVFDPRVLFRMINLGLIDELMRSPSIWLCIDCGRCTESCSQLVDGRRLIDQVKELAILRGVVDIDFHLRVEHANQVIYKYFLNKIDQLFGL